MTDKYIIEGAAFNGDGSTSAVAASDGAAGAWNDFLDVIQNGAPYGTLAAGDVVYVKTATGGVDLEVTLPAAIVWDCGPTASPTEDSPIWFIFDDGTTWSTSGEYGTFKINMTIYNRTMRIEDYINIIALGADPHADITSLEYVCNYTDLSTRAIRYDQSVINGLFIRNLNTGRSAIEHTNTNTNPRTFHLENMRIEVGGAYNTANALAFHNTSYKSSSIVNMVIDCTNFPGGALSPCIIYGPDIYGLKVIPSASYNLPIISDGWDSALNFINRGVIEDVDAGNSAQNPLTLTEFSVMPATSLRYCNQLSIGSFRGGYDFVKQTPRSQVEWDSGGNYPTYLANLPDGTNWSHKVNPARCKDTIVDEISSMKKHYSGTAATKTVTTEILMNDDYTAPKKHHIWMTVAYYDNTTGEMRVASTYLYDAALDASSVLWSVDPTYVYASHNYTRYKLELTTPTAIKQNTPVSVRIFFGTTPPFSDSYFFIDPSFQVT